MSKVYESTVTARVDRDGNIVGRFAQSDWKLSEDPDAKPGAPVVSANGISYQLQDGDDALAVMRRLSRMRSATITFPSA